MINNIMLINKNYVGWLVLLVQIKIFPYENDLFYQKCHILFHILTYILVFEVAILKI